MARCASAGDDDENINIIKSLLTRSLLEKITASASFIAPITADHFEEMPIDILDIDMLLEDRVFGSKLDSDAYEYLEARRSSCVLKPAKH